MSALTPLEIYSKSLHAFVLHGLGTLEAQTQNILTWYWSSGRQEFISAFEHETKLKLAGVKRTDSALVEHAYAGRP
jgi:hypothetical protein